MTSATDIKNAIVGKFELMDSVKSVFSYATSDFNGNYPSVNIIITDGSGEISANVRNLMSYRYRADVFVQMGDVGFSPEEAEALTIGLLDEAVTAFNMDTTLSGLVNYCMPVSWNTSWEDRENDIRVLSIDIEARKLETTYGTI